MESEALLYPNGRTALLPHLGESSLGFSIGLEDVLAGYRGRVVADIPVGTLSRGGRSGLGLRPGSSR